MIIKQTAYAHFISSRSLRSKCGYSFFSSYSYQLAFGYNYTVLSIGKAWTIVVIDKIDKNNVRRIEKISQLSSIFFLILYLYGQTIKTIKTIEFK